MTPYLPPKKTFAQIQAQWNSIQTLDAKKKFKAMREIGNDLLNSYNGREVNVEQLAFYLTILKPIILSRSYGREKLSTLRSKMLKDWLTLSGNGKVETLLSTKSEFISDCPVLCIGDPSYFTELQNIPPQPAKSSAYRLNLINEGKLYEIGTTGDDSFNIELRLVDSSEPCLAAKEMKFVRDSTETVVMHIPTGFLIVEFPFADADEISSLVALSVIPGNYKMSVFFIYKKHDVTFCVVLCKTTTDAKNNYQSIHSFSHIDW